MSFDSRTRKRLQSTGLGFEISMLEFHHEKSPEDIDAMARLAELYTKAGRLGDGLAADLKLVSLEPVNPYFHYNLACSYALMNRVEASLDELELAIRLGYADAEHMNRDPDFANIKKTQRFQALLHRMQR